MTVIRVIDLAAMNKLVAKRHSLDLIKGDNAILVQYDELTKKMLEQSAKNALEYPEPVLSVQAKK